MKQYIIPTTEIAPFSVLSTLCNTSLNDTEQPDEPILAPRYTPESLPKGKNLWSSDDND